jgi:glycolate oxidase FAD binding subunit
MRASRLTQVDVVDDDDALWARQRAGQRSPNRALVRVAARPTALAAIVRASDAAGGTLVGRAGLGTSFVELDPDAVARFLGDLPTGALPVLLDAPAQLREAGDPWGPVPTPALALMQRLKARFDPSGTCNPGIFAGGI